MKQEYLRVPIQHCLRCGHYWLLKSGDRARICPFRGCRSPYWDVPPRKSTDTAQRRHEQCTSEFCLGWRREREEPAPAPAPDGAGKIEQPEVASA